jgi:ABC-type lipoprotein release transport system permease subunit
VKGIVTWCSTEEDVGKPWEEIFLLLAQRFNKYVFNSIKDCIRSVLAQIQVMFPHVPVEKVAEPIADEDFAAAIEQAENGVEDVAVGIATQMTLARGPEYGALIRVEGLEQPQPQETPAQEEASTDVQVHPAARETQPME